MNGRSTTSLDELQRENGELRLRLEEAEETLRALRSGEVDAVLVESEKEQVYTLETADKPYRLLVQQIPQGAATLTVDGTIIYCNGRFAGMLGRPLHGLLRKPILDFVAPESRARLAELFGTCTSTEVHIEADFQRPDGTLVKAYLGCAGLNEGALGECMLVTDHSEQKHYEELRTTQQALRAVGERLELAQQAGRIGTFELDLSTGVLTWSSTGEELYGVRQGEFGDRYEDWKRRMHPEDRERVEAEIQRSIGECADLETEFRAVRPDGVVRWMVASGRVYCDEHGEPHRLVGVNIDVTERKLVLQELEEADHKKDEFLATLAHELRNPLAPIANAVELLKSKSPFDADLQWCGEVIDRQVQVMARLLEDLLDISRASRLRLDLRMEGVDLSSVLEAALDTSRPLIEAGGHELVVDLPSEPIHLDADPVRLAQVFSNLVNNAAKFTEEGGHIRVSAEREGDDVLVSVEDDGIGMSADVLPHVFELFSQGPHTSKASREGLGIGLSLVKSLVERHAGTVEARSEGPGLGSVFRVRLPVCSEPILEDAPPAVEAPEPELPPRCRILIVDDNRDSADVLAELLSMPGNEVRATYDGERCLEIARSFRPDVILLDIGMPLVDGYEACRRIRQQSWGADILMIAVTGWGKEEDRRRSAAAGFDVHLVKPVQPSRLKQLLASHLAGRA